MSEIKIEIKTEEQNQLPKHIQKILKDYSKLPDFSDFIKQTLTQEEFELYKLFFQLRYFDQNAFCIDLDQLQMALNYTRKDAAVSLLKTKLTEGTDFLLEQTESEGHNKQIFILTIKASQKFALLSKTEKSGKIVDFFINTLNLVQNYHILSMHFKHAIYCPKKKVIKLTNLQSIG